MWPGDNPYPIENVLFPRRWLGRHAQGVGQFWKEVMDPTDHDYAAFALAAGQYVMGQLRVVFRQEGLLDRKVQPSGEWLERLVRAAMIVSGPAGGK